MTDRKQGKRLHLPSFSMGGSKTVWVLVGVAVYAGMLTAMATLQARKVNGLEDKITVAKKEAEQLRPQLERIRKLTKEREEVNRRLGIIASLDRDRYFRVQLLNDVSEKLRPNCWLTKMKEKSGSVTIEGITFSNYLIADMMNNLQKSERFRNVTLNIAQEGRVEDHKVIQFTLDTRVSAR
jgi:type IV pilus assembly protein PilN